jgi:hypothetical protein
MLRDQIGLGRLCPPLLRGPANGRRFQRRMPRSAGKIENPDRHGRPEQTLSRASTALLYSRSIMGSRPEKRHNSPAWRAYSIQAFVASDRRRKDSQSSLVGSGGDRGGDTFGTCCEASKWALCNCSNSGQSASAFAGATNPASAAITRTRNPVGFTIMWIPSQPKCPQIRVPSQPLLPARYTGRL